MKNQALCVSASSYLSRYLTLTGSQKLLGWNCAITFTGAAGTRLATHSRALLYTLEQSPWRGVVLAEVLAWLRFPAVHANVQGGIEYLEARLSPRMPGFFYLVLLRTNSAKTFFAAFSSNQVAYAHDLHFR